MLEGKLFARPLGKLAATTARRWAFPQSRTWVVGGRRKPKRREKEKLLFMMGPTQLPEFVSPTRGIARQPASGAWRTVLKNGSQSGQGDAG